ncbi:MAG TPA: response regulator [Pirellulales bacterium]|nr:response regulator [Pirellulales bacterium]
MPRIRRILAIEDNADVLRVQTALLRAMGHEVLPVPTSAEALAAAETFRPDVVIIDLGLPDMSGYDLARALRRLPATSNARLIALTGYGTPEARRHSEEAGIDEHFVKPVSVDDLNRVLNEEE